MDFQPDTTYTADHIPSGETWHIVGVDLKNGKVCAAGYPPSLANLSDCKNFRNPQPLEPDEWEFRGRYFPGDFWL